MLITGQIFLIHNTQKYLKLGITCGFTQIGKKKLSVIPHRHLIKNIGFVKEATHTKIKYKDWYNDLETKEFEKLIFKKQPLKLDQKYDLWLSKNIFKTNLIYLKKKLSILKKFYSKFV